MGRDRLQRTRAQDELQLLGYGLLSLIPVLVLVTCIVCSMVNAS